MSAIAWPKLKRNIVAILRGVTPDEIAGIGDALHEAGVEAIEVPLNSPDPFRSIELLSKRLPDALTGAGTVVRIGDVDRLHQAGGRLLVAPNVDPAILARATEFGMVTMPGVFTATEAFVAHYAGASALKFFPASVLGPAGISALKAVLPREAVVGAVGGVSEADFAAYAKAGVAAFGLGSSLYRPGLDRTEVAKRARAAVAAYDEVFGRTA